MTTTASLPGILAVGALLAALVAPARALDEPSGRAGPWDPAVVDRFRTLPVQEDGRVKPLDTYASFLLLRLNGKRSVSVPDEARFGPVAGRRLSAMEWALDCLFEPERAAGYPVFQVQTSEVLDAIGLSHEGKRKRDRYSFQDLLPGESRLLSLTQRYQAIEARDRTPVQGQVVSLGFNFYQYRLFTQSLDFARARVAVDGDAELRRLFEGRSEVTVSEVLARGPEIAAAIDAVHGPGHDHSDAAGHAELDQLQLRLARLGDGGRELAWIPPNPGDDPSWLTFADVAREAFFQPTGRDLSRQLQCLADMERLAVSRGDPAAFARGVEDLHDRVAGLAEERGEYGKIGLEVALYRSDVFHRSLVLYVLAFLLAAVAWFRPRSRWPWRAVTLAMVAATALLIGGIVVRCILRGRPPVTTLYETVLFVTAIAVPTAMFIEWVNRGRVALSLGALLGAVGMFLASSYERVGGVDTMPTLVAVLDTNFWLATHVTTVTAGYAAGILAGIIAHVHLLGRLFGLRRGDEAFYQGIARMVYGVTCFCLLFSTVGTILGGVWANESWGRFWGWDPKENGALLIVIWTIVMLHARSGGYVRDLGLCMMAVFGNIVVAFSWWGVNLLGVGLHSYGFTAGIQRTLTSFYAIEGLVMALGALAWVRGRMAAARRVPAEGRTAREPTA